MPSRNDHPADRILAIFNRLQEEAKAKTAEFQVERQRLQNEIAALRRANVSTADAPAGKPAVNVESEILRTESLIAEINRKLSDPLLELSAEIRLTRERMELEAYLKGLRYPYEIPLTAVAAGRQ